MTGFKDVVSRLKDFALLVRPTLNNEGFKNLNGSIISEFQHDDFRPNEADALLLLQEVAHRVLPIMRRRRLQVGTLSEFWPSDKYLLGMNYFMGLKICLRLRDPNDEEKFLAVDEIVDTMLHELAHNIHDHHDESFHNFWYRLRGEYFELRLYGGFEFPPQNNKFIWRSIGCSLRNPVKFWFCAGFAIMCSLLLFFGIVTFRFYAGFAIMCSLLL